MTRERWTRAFLWLGVVSFAIALGGKLFDLLILAQAWGRMPPESLKFLPYGPDWPLNPGDFFQPVSVPALLAVLGALIVGWKTPWRYRRWLLVPPVTFLIIWIATPTVFWPILRELYRASHGTLVRTDAQLAATVRRWMIADSLRTIMIALGFVAAVKSISMPYPSQPPP